MKTIKQSYFIRAPLESVWNSLIDPTAIEKWGAGPAKMDDKVGTDFSLWGGDIHGKNTKVVKNKLLVQDWYGGDWPQASKVTFTLTKEKNGTRVDLLHENVPDDEASDISDGWDQYYLGQIKKYLEK